MEDIDTKNACPSCGASAAPGNRSCPQFGHAFRRVNGRPRRHSLKRRSGRAFQGTQDPAAPEPISPVPSRESDPPRALPVSDNERRAILHRAVTRYAQAGWMLSVRLKYSAEVTRWNPPERRRLDISADGDLTDRAVAIPPSELASLREQTEKPWYQRHTGWCIVGGIMALLLLGGAVSNLVQGSKSAPTAPQSNATALQTYTDSMNQALSPTVDGSTQLYQLLGAPRILDPNWQQQVKAQIRNIQSSYQQAKAIQPPPCLNAAHIQLLAGLQTENAAADSLSSGLSDGDVSVIQDSFAQFTEAAQQLNTATAALKASAC